MTGSVIPGAGAFEIAAHAQLMKCKDTIKGRSRLGHLQFCLTKSTASFVNSVRFKIWSTTYVSQSVLLVKDQI